MLHTLLKVSLVLLVVVLVGGATFERKKPDPGPKIKIVIRDGFAHVEVEKRPQDGKVILELVTPKYKVETLSPTEEAERLVVTFLVSKKGIYRLNVLKVDSPKRKVLNFQQFDTSGSS